MKKQVWWFLGGAIVLFAVLFSIGWPWEANDKNQALVSDFQSCAAAGNPVMESYPRQCNTPDGRHFVEVIPAGIPDLIEVDTPFTGATVKSPIHITGKARGNWYFEASFPVTLETADGTVLVQAPIQAQGEWMTTEFVPFEADLAFDYTFGRDEMPVVLILHKDNPSGLPEYDAQVEIPITLVPDVSPVSSGGCIVTGCSGQVCSDEEVMTTCEYRSEYACYKNAKCERQSNGQCGWTQTSALLQCLQSPPALE